VRNGYLMGGEVPILLAAPSCLAARRSPLPRAMISRIQVPRTTLLGDVINNRSHGFRSVELERRRAGPALEPAPLVNAQ